MMAAKRNEGIVERVTVKTIAEMANVSIGTVDRALNGRGRINPDTKERILKIAKMMNYTPNRTAQALKRQRQIRIGIVMADTPIQFCDHLRHGIEDALGEMDDYGIVGEFLLSHSLSARDQMEVVSGIEPERFDAFFDVVHAVPQLGVVVVAACGGERQQEREAPKGEFFHHDFEVRINK